MFYFSKFSQKILDLPPYGSRINKVQTKKQRRQIFKKCRKRRDGIKMKIKQVEDIARLQEIKLFRKMDLSIEEMKALFEKKKSLQICLEQHLKELEYRKEGLTKMQDICERLISEHQSLETLNAEECLEEIEQMEKEGAKFMSVNKMDVHKKKRKGAIIGAVVMTVLMALTIGFMLWGNSQDPIPFGLLVFLIAIPVALIIGLWIALAGRMKEIEGGEEDEASKY